MDTNLIRLKLSEDTKEFVQGLFSSFKTKDKTTSKMLAKAIVVDINIVMETNDIDVSSILEKIGSLIPINNKLINDYVRYEISTIKDLIGRQDDTFPFSKGYFGEGFSRGDGVNTDFEMYNGFRVLLTELEEMG